MQCYTISSTVLYTNVPCGDTIKVRCMDEYVKVYSTEISSYNFEKITQTHLHLAKLL